MNYNVVYSKSINESKRLIFPALYYERQMKQVYLEVVDQQSCNTSILGATRKVPYRLNENMFCAGGGLGHDACSVSTFPDNRYTKSKYLGFISMVII